MRNNVTPANMSSWLSVDSPSSPAMFAVTYSSGGMATAILWHAKKVDSDALGCWPCVFSLSPLLD